MTYIRGIQAADSPSIDAFGRWRTSDTGQRFDVEFIYDKQPLLIDEVTTGAATATHDANARDVTLAIVNTTNGTSKALYSHYDIPYTAGNSQLIDITGTLNYANIASGTAYLFIRSKVSGSVVETTYQQSAWNKNTVLDVNWSYSQILMMDFQSLKIGRIRFFLVRNGLAVPIHEIYNDNVRNTGYWQTPTLPVFWRIYNDATYTYMEMGYGDTDNGIGIRYRIAANASATMKAICSTVKSEGGLEVGTMSGYPFSISNRTTSITASTTLVPILSIRMASTFNSITNRGLAIPVGYSITADNPINFRIFYRPTLTGASWAAVDTNSFMEYDVSSTVISGGTLLDDDHTTSARNTPSADEGLLSRVFMSLGRTGTSDILTIAAVRTSTNNANVLAGLKWKEIR